MTATPTPATVDSFMSLLLNHENQISEVFRVLQDNKATTGKRREAIDASSAARNALIAEVERIAAQAAPTPSETGHGAWHDLNSAADAVLMVGKAGDWDAIYCYRLAKWLRDLATTSTQPPQAPVVQAGEYPPLPEPDAFVAMNYEGSIIIPPQDFPKWGSAYKVFTADQMRAYVDAYVAMQKAKS